MSTDFLRYSPYLAQVPADFDRNLDLVLQGIDRYIPGTPSSEPRGKPEGRAVRATHAKSYGVAKAEVEILGNLPPEYAQGIYAKPGRYGALARFTNGSPHLGMDSMLPRAMGLSVKIFGIEGPKLLEDEANSRTFDYSNINLPVFFCSTVEQYVVVQQLNVDQPTYMSEGVTGRNRLFRDFLTLKGTLPPDRYLRVEFSAFLRATALPPKNLLLFSYWTMGAVRHGDYVAKLRFAPTETSASSVVQRDLLPTATAGRAATAAQRRLLSGSRVGAAGPSLRVRHPGSTVDRSRSDAYRQCFSGMAGGVQPLRDCRQIEAAAAGHLKLRQCRSDGCAVHQSVARHRGTRAAR